MSDDKSNFDKANEAAQLAVAVAPVFVQLMGAFGDVIAKLHKAIHGESS